MGTQRFFLRRVRLAAAFPTFVLPLARACAAKRLRCAACFFVAILVVPLRVSAFSGPYMRRGQFTTRHGGFRCDRRGQPWRWFVGPFTGCRTQLGITPEVVALGVKYRFFDVRGNVGHCITPLHRKKVIQAEFRFRGNVVCASCFNLHDNPSATMSSANANSATTKR